MTAYSIYEVKKEMYNVCGRESLFISESEKASLRKFAESQVKEGARNGN